MHKRSGGISNKKRYSLPERWEKYSAIGGIVPGTRFLPFKTPLNEEICRRTLTENEWFTPAMLLQRAPNLKLIIDLTQTNRYYSKQDIEKNGLQYRKIVCPGGGNQLPPRYIIQEFNRIIDSFLESEDALNQDALIGVHCTHGLNRTGYLICKYMVERSGISAQTAIADFENARGHKMERSLYVDDIVENRRFGLRPHRQHRRSNLEHPGFRTFPHNQPMPAAVEQFRFSSAHNQPRRAVAEDSRFSSSPHNQPRRAVAEDSRFSSSPHNQPMRAVAEDFRFSSSSHNQPMRAVAEDLQFSSSPHNQPMHAVVERSRFRTTTPYNQDYPSPYKQNSHTGSPRLFYSHPTKHGFQRKESDLCYPTFSKN